MTTNTKQQQTTMLSPLAEHPCLLSPHRPTLLPPSTELQLILIKPQNLQSKAPCRIMMKGFWDLFAGGCLGWTPTALPLSPTRFHPLVRYRWTVFVGQVCYCHCYCYCYCYCYCCCYCYHVTLTSHYRQIVFVWQVYYCHWRFNHLHHEIALCWADPHHHNRICKKYPTNVNANSLWFFSLTKFRFCLKDGFP